MPRRLEPIVIGAAAAYLVVLGWAMVSLSYDVWGALVVAPIMLMVTVPIVRRVFSAELSRVFPFAVLGLFAKFAGAAVRYWVSFDAYGGAADAAAYHDVAKLASQNFRSGNASIGVVIPHGVGRVFIERLTALLYTVFGSSRLAGFLLFAWMGYWGAVLFVRAAALAVPSLAKRRYAVLMFFLPSMLYWPSSIGKEAYLCLTLGLASYGIALLLTGSTGPRSWLYTVVGIAASAFARPHFAVIWVGGLVAALVGGLLAGAGHGRRSRAGAGVILVVAMVGLFAAASATARYLNPDSETLASTPTGATISAIFNETERRTEQGGSSFQTITITGPQTWPYAIVRTLTRPLLSEARSTAQLLPAVEMTALLALAVWGWRRIANIPRLLRRTPYLVFGLIVLIMFGLAFTSVGNLGILTRQRSLVLPLLALLVCVPAPKRPRAARPPAFTSGRVRVESHA